MRNFIVIYVLATIGLSIITTKAGVFPSTLVIPHLHYADGSYSVRIVGFVVFLLLIVPLYILMIVRSIVSKRQTADKRLIDETSIILKRDKSLFGGIYEMEVYIDGQKTATLMPGKEREIFISPGDHLLKITKGSVTAQLSISTTGKQFKTFQTGFTSGGELKEIYLHEVISQDE